MIPKNHYMKRDKPAKLSRIPLRVKAVLAELLVASIKAELVPEKVGQPAVNSEVPFSEVPVPESAFHDTTQLHDPNQAHTRSPRL